MSDTPRFSCWPIRVTTPLGVKAWAVRDTERPGQQITYYGPIAARDTMRYLEAQKPVDGWAHATIYDNNWEPIA